MILIISQEKNRRKDEKKKTGSVFYQETKPNLEVLCGASLCFEVRRFFEERVGVWKDKKKGIKEGRVPPLVGSF